MKKDGIWKISRFTYGKFICCREEFKAKMKQNIKQLIEWRVLESY